MNHIGRLKKFGFSRIGEFAGGDDLISLKRDGKLAGYISDKLEVMGDLASIENIIYAYVVNKVVVYLGESERTFAKRYNNHIRNLVDYAIKKKPAYLRWVAFFEETERYEIWQMPAPKVEVMGLSLSIRQDFETALIGVFTPPMNTRTKGN